MRIFDVHAHVYPDALAPRAVAALDRGSADPRVRIRGDGRLDTLIRLGDGAGIARTAVCAVATVPRQVESINRFILSAARARPRRLLPFAALHPDCPDPGAAVEALVRDGFRGVKLHPEAQGFAADDPAALPLFRALAGRLPVLMHCGDPVRRESSPERILRLLDRVPGLTLICAHLGGWTRWERAAEEMRGAGLWVDTSSSLYALEPQQAAAILRGYGCDRVLFGTDFPAWLPGPELGRFLALPLDPQEREDILWNNHLKLFGPP